jgi:hypothetical protein
MRLIDFATKLTAVLQDGFLASCHNFLGPCLYILNRSKPGKLLFRFENVTVIFDSLYAEAADAVKSLTALSASFS